MLNQNKKTLDPTGRKKLLYLQTLHTSAFSYKVGIIVIRVVTGFR